MCAERLCMHKCGFVYVLMYVCAFVYEHTIFVIVHLFEICTQNVEKCCK